MKIKEETGVQREESHLQTEAKVEAGMPTQALLSRKWQRRIPPHPLDVFRDDIAPQHLALSVGWFVLFVFLTPTCETYCTVQ